MLYFSSLFAFSLPIPIVPLEMCPFSYVNMSQRIHMLSFFLAYSFTTDLVDGASHISEGVRCASIPLRGRTRNGAHSLLMTRKSTKIN